MWLKMHLFIGLIVNVCIQDNKMKSAGEILKVISYWMNPELIENILLFHHKADLYLDQKFYRNIIHPPIPAEALALLQNSDLEVNPFHHGEIVCASSHKSTLRRNRTANNFSNKIIDFSQVSQLLNAAFASDADLSRPYPSAGALYPVEVFCVIFADRLHNPPCSGVYHFRSLTKTLQPIKIYEAEVMRSILFSMEMENARNPNMCLIYVAHIGKAVAKYRYRGYRYTLMEVGFMCHQADLVAQQLELKNKLYSGFNDYELLKFIDLDPITFVPLIIQSFGK